MKKLFILALVCFAALAVSAQNIQIHYDFGRHINSKDLHGRQDVTLTYETFKADNLGSWYYFADLDIDRDGVRGAYSEISREFNVGDKGFAAHMELDGGLSKDGGVFQSAALVGAAWNGHNEDYSTTYSIQAMYKQFFGQKNYQSGNSTNGYASFQITGVWSTNFANNKLTFSGFVDLWRGHKTVTHHGTLVILTEPQLWYNVNKKFSIGTEVEMSNNFLYQTCSPYANNKFYVNPTLAVKFKL